MKYFIKNSFFIILLISACSINKSSNQQKEAFMESQGHYSRSLKTEPPIFPDINPKKEFEMLEEALIPIQGWHQILQNQRYMSFRFIGRDNKAYWALLFLISSANYAHRIYLVAHDSEKLVYKGEFEARLWRQKKNHDVLAITPKLQQCSSPTFNFPTHSPLYPYKSIVFVNGRGHVGYTLETPQKTDFVVKPYVVGLSSVDNRSKEVTNIIPTTRKVSPLLNHVIQNSGIWMEFQYKKGYWMQYQNYYSYDLFEFQLLYRILKDGQVVDEGLTRLKSYMTLDRHESEGALVFEKPFVFPGLEASYNTLNLFRKPLKGTRGNISTGVYLDKSNFDIWYATNPPTRSQEMILRKKAESFIKLNKSGSFRE